MKRSRRALSARWELVKTGWVFLACPTHIMKNKILYKHIISVLLLLFTAHAALAGTVLSSALRPVSAANSVTVGQIARKTSSAGDQPLLVDGDATIPGKTITGFVAFQDPSDKDDVLVPLWHDDIESEISFFRTVVGEIKVLLENRRTTRAKRDQALVINNEASRLLDKYSKLVLNKLALMKATEVDADTPLSETDSTGMLKSFLQAAEAGYYNLLGTSERDYTISIRALKLLGLLLAGEEDIELQLVEYNSSIPTEQELAELTVKAQQEYDRLREVMSSMDLVYKTQENASKAAAETNLIKLKALLNKSIADYDRLTKLFKQSFGGTQDETTKDALRAIQNLRESFSSIAREWDNIDESNVLRVGRVKADRKKRLFYTQVANLEAKLNEAWGVIPDHVKSQLRTKRKAKIEALIMNTLSSLRRAEESALSISSALAAQEMGFVMQMIVADVAGSWVALKREPDTQYPASILFIQEENAPIAHMIQNHPHFKILAEAVADEPGKDASDIKKRFWASQKDAFTVAQEVVAHLREGERVVHKTKRSRRPIVLVMDDQMTPSAITLLATRYNIVGIVSEVGNVTGHLALFARGLGIPFVKVNMSEQGAIKLEHIKNTVENSTKVIVQTKAGAAKTIVTFNPGTEESRNAGIEKIHDDLKDVFAQKHNADPVVTRDGLKTTVLVNAGLPITSAVNSAASGIGLVRSEFFLQEHIGILRSYAQAIGEHVREGRTTHVLREPQRELLFFDISKDFYLQIASFGNKPGPIVFRAWDIKNDPKGKALLNAMFENPAEQRTGSDFYKTGVGYDMFVMWTEALLGSIIKARKNNINTPIIASIPEIHNAEEVKWFFSKVLPRAIANQKARLSQTREGLKAFKGTKEEAELSNAVRELEFGIMVETLGIEESISQILEYGKLPNNKSKSITHFSIGTNDWTNYLVSDVLGVPVDRDDAILEKKAMSLDPLLLRKIIRLVQQIAEWNQAHLDDIKTVSVCGDIASNEKFILFTLWLQKQFLVEVRISVPEDSISRLKNFIRFVDTEIDLNIDGSPTEESIFDDIDVQIDTIAARRVKDIYHRMANDNESGYRQEVTEAFREHLKLLDIVAGKTSFAGHSQHKTYQRIATQA